MQAYFELEQVFSITMPKPVFEIPIACKKKNVLVFHLEYHCIVLWLIRLTNCLKMGWTGGSRFERLSPVLPFDLKISCLRETSTNFQFFLKIPICIASYFVFWCFNCVTAIGNVKNTLKIHVNSLFLQWFMKVLQSMCWKMAKLYF